MRKGSDIFEILNFIGNDDISHINEYVLDRFIFLKEKITNNEFYTAFIGQFKRGKSSLINSILGQNILPTSVIPVTSVITILKYGENQKAIVEYNDGKKLEVEVSSISYYISESKNPNNIHNVKYVILYIPDKLLKKGINIVDTPGIGSTFIHNTKAANDIIPKLDAVFFVTSFDPGITESEIKFITEVEKVTNNINFIINKSDLISEADKEEFLKYFTDTLKSVRGINRKPFIISSKYAMEAKIEKSKKKYLKSGFEEFEAYIEEIIEKRRNEILTVSLHKQIAYLVDEIIFYNNIRIQNIELPIEKLEDKIESAELLISQFKTEIDKSQINIKYDIERVYKLMSEGIESYQHDHINDYFNLINEYYESNKTENHKNFRQGIDTLLMNKMKSELEEFRISLGQKIEKKILEVYGIYEQIKIDYLKRIHVIFSDLYNLKAPKTKFESKYTKESCFIYLSKSNKLFLEVDFMKMGYLLPRNIKNKYYKDKLLKDLRGLIQFNLGYLSDSLDRQIEKEYRNLCKEYNPLLESLLKITSELKSAIESKRNKDKISDADVLIKYKEIDNKLKTYKEQLSIT